MTRQVAKGYLEYLCEEYFNEPANGLSYNSLKVMNTKLDRRESFSVQKECFPANESLRTAV